MGSSISTPLPRLAVPTGKVRICIAGFPISHHTGRARTIASLIAETYPETYETWFYFDGSGFRPDFLSTVKAELSQEQQETFKDHKTSPFCWLEKSDGTKVALGGRDRLCEWVQGTFATDDKEKDAKLLKLCTNPPSLWELRFDNSTPGTAKTEE